MANVKVPALLYKMSKASQKAWYKKNNMEMPDEPVERSAAVAKRVKVAPRKASDVKPDSVRAINTARMAAYMAKGGRAPIGAAGSGGNSVMAGSNMSTVRGIITGIKAGFNPTVSLDPYESERAKKTGPRSLKLAKEEVEQVDEAASDKSLSAKAAKSGISVGTLRSVYRRGVAAWNSGHRPGTTPSQWGHARVNSYINKGKGTYHGADKDLRENVDEGSKRMSAAVRLQRAFEREKVSSDASRERGKEILAQARAEYAKKQAAKTNEEVEQVDEVDYKKYLKVSHEKRPSKFSAVDAALSAEKEGNPNPARKLRNSLDARKFANKQLAKQFAKTRPAQKYPVYVPGRTYVGDSVELDGSVIDEVNARRISKLTGGDYSKQDVKDNLKSLKTEDTEMKYIEEKLTAADPASKYIKDFVASENPKFAEKSKKERISMALGAYYAAKGKKNEEIVLEEPKDAADVGEYDYEGDMAKSQLRSIMANSKRMYDMLEDTTNLPEWVQSKITLAEDYIVTASNYMETEMNEEVEQVTEAEGTVAVTPKEKSLAAHHGDKTKITFGDVIKARLKSAAAKKMGK